MKSRAVMSRAVGVFALALFALLVLVPPVPAAEIAADYSGLRSDGVTTHGGALGFGLLHKNGHLRWIAELSFQSGDAAGGESRREIGLLAGAAFAPWPAGRLSPFVSTKLGVVGAQREVQVFGVSIGPAGVCDGGCPYSTGPAAEFGGGLDLHLGGPWTLRLVQADYRLRHLDGETDHAWRFSAGIVHR